MVGRRVTRLALTKHLTVHVLCDGTDASSPTESIPASSDDGLAFQEGRRVSMGRQFAWLTVSRLLAAGLQAVSLLVLARFASVPEFALVAGFLGLAAFAQMAVDFGLSTLAIRERAADPSSDLPAACMALHAKISIALSLLTLAVFLLLGLIANDVFLALLPLGLWIGADRSADAWAALWVADGYASRSALSVVIRRATTLGGFATLAWLGLDAVLAFASASGLVSVAAAVIVRRAVSVRLAPRASESKTRLVAKGRSFWVNSAVTQARNVDVALTGALVGAVEAGLFAIPARLTGPLRLVSASLATVLLPAAARARSSAEVTRLLRISAVAWLALSVLYVGCAAVVPAVLPVVLGEAYSGAVVPLQVTLVGLAAASAASLLNALLQGLGRQRAVALTSTATTGFYIAFVGAGAIVNGAIGAAVGGAVAYLVQACLLVSYMSIRPSVIRCRSGWGSIA
ncbi:Membrane protein involved in the export of O-antigen and teichoic acid [Blastococcus sp. DSM 46786]|nr:Membrane protein involved in the export of O-antigen and teichoic acid [Blastococcus sp. DSM 46786]